MSNTKKGNQANIVSRVMGGSAVATYLSTISSDQAARFADQADPKVVSNKKLFNDIGVQCKKMDAAFTSLRTIVDSLREQSVFLDDPASVITAGLYIAEKHNDAKVDSINRYVSNLKQLLRCPPEILPANPSITVSLPAWQTVGDEVDVSITVNKQLQVWHGVVVTVGSPRSCHVYWVGCPIFKATSRRQAEAMIGNPVKVDRKSTRWHQPGAGAREGDFPTFSVDWIKDTYIPKRYGEQPQEVVVIQSDDDADVSGNVKLSGIDIRGDGKQVPSTKQKRKGKSKHATPTPSKSAKKKRRDSSGKVADHEGETDQELDKGAAMKLEVKKRCKKLSISVFHWLAPYIKCDVFIEDLLKLDTYPSLQSNDNVFHHYLRVLERLRFGQGCMYNAADAFSAYFSLQSAALSAYEIREVKFDQGKYDKYISDIDKDLVASYTDAFTRNELVIISCLLANPGLSFTNILQKTGVVKSSGMVRGMAYVPQQLEKFFHERLLKLRITDSRYHPKYMQGLSTVILSSSYCHQQLGTWGYGEEWKSKTARVLKLENFPSCFSINGVYALVDHKVDSDAAGGDTTVYAQVMSRKASNDLCIPPEFISGAISKQYALVLLYQPQCTSRFNARIIHWISLGRGQVRNPICLARISLRMKDQNFVVEQAQMFSHLDHKGAPQYQPISGFAPTAKWSDVEARSGVAIEYGPDLMLRRECSRSKTASLSAQCEHCDGNFFHAKGQWAKDGTVHGKYRLGLGHRPLMTDTQMEDPNLVEPLFLEGPAHQNSQSVLIGINKNTTLTFPPPPPGVDGSRRLQDNVVQPTPFGGLSIFGFLEDHMGSAYGDEANERPHVYAHSSDLRQFPVNSAANLLLVFALKERIEHLRDQKQKCTPAMRILNTPCQADDVSITHKCAGAIEDYVDDDDDLEDALKHLIFDLLITSTFKTEGQKRMFKEVQSRARTGSTVSADAAPSGKKRRKKD
jgi:hypothetical protein